MWSEKRNKSWNFRMSQVRDNPVNPRGRTEKLDEGSKLPHSYFESGRTMGLERWFNN